MEIKCPNCSTIMECEECIEESLYTETREAKQLSVYSCPSCGKSYSVDIWFDIQIRSTEFFEETSSDW